MADTARGPRTPRGKAIAWTDEDLDRLSQVTPEDIASAQSAWRRWLPARYAGLVDAPPHEGDAGEPEAGT